MATSSINKVVLLKYIDNINKKNTDDNKIIKKLDRISLNFDEADENQNVFEVILILSDTTNVKQTLSEIIAVLDNISYIKEFVEKEKGSLKLRIETFINEISKIEDIQNLLFEKEGPKNTMISTSGLSKEKVEFKNNKIQLENKLDEITSFRIIPNNYYLFNSNKRLTLTIIIYLFLGFIAGMITIVLKK